MHWERQGGLDLVAAWSPAASRMALSGLLHLAGARLLLFILEDPDFLVPPASVTSSSYTCSSVYPRPLTQPGTRHFLKLPSSVFCLLDFWVPLPGGSLPLAGLFRGREAGTHFPCVLKIEASVLVFSKFVLYALKILSGLMPTTYFFVNY